MFSPRVFLLLAVGLAACAALPAQAPQPSDKPVPRPVTAITDDDLDESWFGIPFFSNLFGPLWQMFPDFSGIGPNIVSDDDKFLVNVRVKDYKKEDLKVKVKNGFIFVQGSHEAKHTEHDLFASQFFHTYSLPLNSSSADVKAELSSDGWLTVTAPISEAPVEEAKDQERVVEITETGAPYQPAKVKPTPQGVDDELATEAADDRKEPTTTPTVDREEVTDKDNSIPHGKEAVPI